MIHLALSIAAFLFLAVLAYGVAMLLWAVCWVTLAYLISAGEWFCNLFTESDKDKR